MSGSDGPHAPIHLAPRMITRAAVLERIGAPLLVTELELDAPGPGEVLVELHASGVCHSDLNAIDGTAATPCPAVLGHEGGGVVRQLGRGVSRVAVGDHVALSWAPSCGHCAECLDDLPHLCGTAWPMMARGTLLDGTTRLSRDGEPVYHYSFLSSFAEHAVVPEGSCVRIPDDVPLEIAGLVGCAVTTGICAVWRSAAVRPGQRAAVIGCGGVGLSAVIGLAAVSASPIVAVDLDASKLETALSLGATAAVEWAGSPEATAERVQAVSGGVDFAFEATGRPEAMLAGFLSTRRRGTTVCMGISSEQAVLPLPALSLPRMERRVMGALYGSARPDRDFLVILDQYRRGRLPLDRLVSDRLPLDRIGEAFDMLRNGTSLRTVIDLTAAS
jgi:Zn-dependent alcohol dehydrogenase